MGSSLSLNLAEKTGRKVSGFDLSVDKGLATEARAAAEGLGPLFASFAELPAFVASLAAPRRIVLLVPAGAAVDACLGELRGLLEAGDVVMDGGNEWFENTERREREMAAIGIHYMGCGVSGGAEGARHGPALMVGGPRPAWDLFAEALTAIAARAPGDGSPCVVYCGKGGAGNYVKMVHNGIEYGDMQLIGEAFALLRDSGMSNEAIAALFARWNEPGHPLQSFLVEITSRILLVKDDDDDQGGSLVDRVLDRAGSKGTGKWTVKDAADLGVPLPTVSAALEARYLSALKPLRLRAGDVLHAKGQGSSPLLLEEEGSRGLAESLEAALVCAKICSYAQGLSVIATAASEHGWTDDLRLPAVLDCWRGGCIIRAKLLADFGAALKLNPDLDNLLLAPSIAALIHERQSSWRHVVAHAVMRGIPAPALANSLAYFDSIRSPRLNAAALIQCQRDCFGGHTYERIDKPQDQAFTSDWLRLAARNDN